MTAVRPRQDGRVFAAVRAMKLRTRAQVNNARDHAIRLKGRKYLLRPRAVAGESLRWCNNGGEADFDLWGCFQHQKKSTGGRERHGSAIMLHMLFIVSPEWVTKAGDLHDKTNPRNVALFEEAIACAEKEIGGVVAARIDLDELGGAVIDVFCTPVFKRSRTKKNGTQGNIVAEISVAKALKAMHLRHRTELDNRETGSLQNMWAGWAQTHLDRTIERGERAVKTGRVHLETFDYKLQQEALAAMEANLADALRERDEVEREIAVKETELADIELRALHARMDMDDRETRIDERERAVLEVEAVLVSRSSEIAQLSEVQQTRASDLARQQAALHAGWEELSRANASLQDGTLDLQKGREALKADRDQLTAEHGMLETERLNLLQQQKMLKADRQQIADEHAEIAQRQLYWDAEYEKAYSWFEAETGKVETRESALGAAEVMMATREIAVKDAETAVAAEKNRLLDLGRDVQMFSQQAMTGGFLLQQSIDRSQAYEQELATQLKESGERTQMLETRERTIIDREAGVDALVANRLSSKTQELEEQAEKAAEALRNRGRELDERNAKMDIILEARLADRRRELKAQADERMRRIDARDDVLRQNEVDLQSRAENVQKRETDLAARASHFAKGVKAFTQLNAWLAGGNLGQKSKEFVETLLAQPKMASFVDRLTSADRKAAESERRAAEAERQTAEATRRTAEATAALQRRKKALEEEERTFEAEKQDLIAENKRVTAIMADGEKSLNALSRLAKQLQNFFPTNGPVGQALVPLNNLLRRAGNVLASFYGTDRDQGRGGRE
jgi:hypothetical protein